MKISILTILPSLNLCDGVVSYAMNYYRVLNHDNYRMDFLSVQFTNSPYIDEIKKCGDQVFFLPKVRKGDIWKFSKAVDAFFSFHHDYDIVHCHTSNTGAIFLKYAKKYEISTRILHSHATKSAEKKWKEIRNALIIPFTKYYATDNFACSKLAGHYLFKNGSYDLIHNAIDIGRFTYCERVRRELKSELSLKAELIIGTVGRICIQKNPYYIVDIIAQLAQYNENFIFLWFGDGPLAEQIKAYALKKKIFQKIKFMGIRADVCNYYSLMDVFILPSLFEGLPIVGIEAQAAGLPVLVSDTITREMDVTGFCKFLPLNNLKPWVNTIQQVAGKRNPHATVSLIKNGYSIQDESVKLEKLYSRKASLNKQCK